MRPPCRPLKWEIGSPPDGALSIVAARPVSAVEGHMDSAANNITAHHLVDPSDRGMTKQTLEIVMNAIAIDLTSSAVSRNPSTGVLIKTYPFLKPQEIESTLAANSKAFKVWRDTPMAGRVACYRRLAAMLRSRSDASPCSRPVRWERPSSPRTPRSRSAPWLSSGLLNTGRRSSPSSRRGGGNRPHPRLLPAHWVGARCHALELPALAGDARCRSDHAVR